MALGPTLERIAAAITAFTDAVAARLAPAMPWLFLALRRSLIPTLIWLVVAALFFVLPQSREVLHGLSEPVLRSFTEFDSNDRSSINAWALVSYVGTAAVLALAIWYSARLLATVDAHLGAPNALEEPARAAGLQQAGVWYPRGLGVSALAAAVGALIYANYTPRLSQAPALGLAVLAVAAPLVAAAGSLLASAVPTASRKARVLIALGALGMAAAAVMLVMWHSKWPMWLWCIASAVLPALLLVFLVRRRRLLRASDPADAQVAARPRVFGEVIVVIGALVLFGGAVLLLLALLPPVAMRVYGSAAAILLFLSAATLWLTGAQLVLRHVARNVPGFTTAVLAVFAIGVALIGSEDLGREALAARPQALIIGTRDASAAPVAPAARAASAVPRSLYVNAHGGGLRAAVFTAQTLARADDATCGAFGEQVAAFSGVSGGSLGIATYLVARQELVARGGWTECARDAGGAAAKTPLADIVTGALVQDHLSTVIGRMLAVDAPHLWGAPIRGKALLDSWQHALLASLGTRLSELHADRASFAGLALPLAALTGGFARAPAVYFNATDADSGHITWFSNGRGGMAATYAQQERAVSLSVGQAVLHSARFPIVTPAGGFEFPWAPERTARLIDGGYADNSGTTTLFDALAGGTPPHDAGAVPRMININGNPPEDAQCSKAGGTPPILTAVRGLLQARTAHAERAIERLERLANTPRIDVRLDFEQAFAEPNAAPGALCAKVARAQQAPLGWYMSYEAAAVVARSAELGVAGVCASLALPCRLAKVAVPTQY